MKFRITEGNFKGLLKEKPRETEITSNKRELRISASSNNQESTVTKRNKNYTH